MRGVVLSVAIWASFQGVAWSQSLASIGGPAEVPPASYTGQQYVDSRGCIFLKAGYGGQTTWVPRVNAQRKAMCGFPPTFGKVVIEMADETAPVVVTPRVAAVAAPAPKPGPVVAPRIDPATYTPAPVAAAAPPSPKTATRAQTSAGSHQVARTGPGPGKIGCFTSAPVAEVVRLRNGGTAVVCTRGDGGASGWRPPIYPAGSPVGVALTDPVAKQALDPARVTDGQSGSTVVYALDALQGLPPKGYKPAWTDDRLNPQRAKGVAAGQAAQDRIWTRQVPAQLVATQKRQAPQVTVSTKSGPASAAASASGKALVQVGTFGVASNADGAAARLAALGLPVVKARTTKGGKALQIVFAGPFASASAAQAALSAARRAGFSDAFVR